MFPRAALLAFVLLQGALLGAAEPCAPGQRRCDADGRVLSVCDARALWAEETDCAALGGVCLEGRCLPLNLTRVGESCTDIGSYQCSIDCSGMEFCSEFGKWTEYKPCTQAGTLCVFAYSHVVPTCEKVDVCPPRDSDAICLQTGRYPGLGDKCREYYDCNTPLQGSYYAGVRKYCQDGFEYNACSGNCDILHTGTCQSSPDACTTSPSIHVIEENLKLYYSCIAKGVPLWHRCGEGQVYSVLLAQCVSQTSYCSGGTGYEDSSSTTAPSGFTCPGVGNYEFSGSNCYYYSCYSGGHFEVKLCASGYHYEEKDKQCVYGSCTS